MNQLEEDQRLNCHLDNLQRRLPNRVAYWLDRLRQPEARWVRLPTGFLFIFGGFLGFLPILGFWMLPIGMLLLSLDMPVLRTPTTRALDWAERRLTGTSSCSKEGS